MFKFWFQNCVWIRSISEDTKFYHIVLDTRLILLVFQTLQSVYHRLIFSQQISVRNLNIVWVFGERNNLMYKIFLNTL